MATIFKSEEAREIDALEQIEKRIERRERRERLHHIIIAGLSILLAASLVGHVTCRRRR